MEFSSILKEIRLEREEMEDGISEISFLPTDKSYPFKAHHQQFSMKISNVLSPGEERGKRWRVGGISTNFHPNSTQPKKPCS